MIDLGEVKTKEDALNAILALDNEIGHHKSWIRETSNPRKIKSRKYCIRFNEQKIKELMEKYSITKEELY